MLKRHFFDLLDEQFKEHSITAKINNLSLIKNYWLDEYIESITRDFVYCNNCKQFLPKSELIVHNEFEQQPARIGSYVVKRKINYLCTTCPKCSHKVKRILSTKLITRNEWN